MFSVSPAGLLGTSRLRLFICCLLVLPFLAQGQTKKEANSGTIYQKFTPPGVAHLRDSIYIDVREMDNVSYLEYLYYVKKDSSAAYYQSQLPDSTVWQNSFPQLNLANPYYLRNPAFRFYPVVGVTYEQAVAYCQWRSALVNKGYRKGVIKKSKELKGYDITVEYRLPTKEEWEFAATAGLNPKVYPYGMARPSKGPAQTPAVVSSLVNCIDSLGISPPKGAVAHAMEFNVLEDFYFTTDAPGFSCLSEKSLGPEDVRYNPANALGLYNMIGNVAEMTATKGLAKGGTFKHSLAEISISRDFTYDAPTDWLGFRCVAVVHVKKK
ncbi:SUMF1/EgtB/PvdO family nonheme iron enzyme [Rufibacter sp. LB8]|uniref:SUMF1/EgtB/PvdO family nonheme iron enzyme n=1 Tax=Rufibacter sp. LB8 TaxID=2777781 RepID=UPI00178C3F11|nr:SUMF1/EgtB/PvdO family nonheme iron enzyme [Rufibacter sp. LB8]